MLHSYSSGVFSSRSIELSTCDSVAMRVLCGDTHPEHDTICAKWAAACEKAFSHVLELAARVGVMKVGKVTVAIDGTKILANASKHSAVSCEKAGEAMRELDMEVAELLEKAETADSTPLEDGLTVPEEIARREERKAKLQAARAVMEARAAVRAAAERAEYHPGMGLSGTFPPSRREGPSKKPSNPPGVRFRTPCGS